MDNELAKAYVQIIPTTKGIQGALEKELGSAGSTSGEKFNSAFGDKLKTGLATAAKAGLAALGAAAAGISALGTQSIKLYADYEQLVGGVETLFGAGGASLEEYASSVGKTVSDAESEYNSLMAAQNEVMSNANNAWQTAGMSANEYMNTVTSFSASLIQGLGGDTQAAAAIADVAITDMADNANKMGTDISMIQNAYQGFAKQNYEMLDNLKLGYGGTQAEMARLINDSGVLGDTMTVTAETVNQVSFDKMVEAIHVIQGEMGITGTTAKEASSTIQGSISSMRAAWDNFLTGMADPQQDFDALLGNLVDSVVTVGENLVPRIQMLLPRLAEGLTQLAQSILPYIPTTLQTLLPTLIDGASSLISGFTAVLPELLTTALSTLPQLVGAAVSIIGSLTNALIAAAPQLLSAGAQLLSQLLTGIQTGLPLLAERLPILIQSGLTYLTQQLPLVMTAGTQLLDGVLSGIFTALPALAVQVPVIVQTFLDGITAQLPVVLNKGVELLTNFVNGILATIPGMLAQLPQIIDAIITFVTDNLPTIIDAGITLLLNLTSGIIGAIPQLVAQLPKIISSITGGLANSMPKIIQSGVQLLQKLSSGIISAIPQLVAALPQIITAIVSGIGAMMGGIVDIGVQIVKGIWQGIQSMVSWFTSQVKSFFSGIVNGVKNILGIRSPSRVFAGIGGYMAQGLGEGWSDEYDSVSRGLLSSVQNTSSAAANELDGALLSSGKIGADLALSYSGGAGNSMLAAMQELGDRIERMRIYLDSGRLVGGIAKDMDSALGKIDARAVRTS